MIINISKYVLSIDTEPIYCYIIFNSSKSLHIIAQIIEFCLTVSYESLILNN